MMMLTRVVSRAWIGKSAAASYITPLRCVLSPKATETMRPPYVNSNTGPKTTGDGWGCRLDGISTRKASTNGFGPEIVGMGYLRLLCSTYYLKLLNIGALIPLYYQKK